MSTCTEVTDDLEALVAGDRDVIARHADHLAGCDACRDLRHEASELARTIATAGHDHVAADPEGLGAREIGRASGRERG